MSSAAAFTTYRWRDASKR
ncbi:hypothetical protein [Aeromicrobium sp. 9AM]